MRKRGLLSQLILAGAVLRSQPGRGEVALSVAFMFGFLFFGKDSAARNTNEEGSARLQDCKAHGHDRDWLLAADNPCIDPADFRPQASHKTPLAITRKG
jgi:hypothetical protein